MGGTNSSTISKLRFHVNNKDVHIHDDNQSIKFEKEAEDFKTEAEEALEVFNKTDGVIKISGKGKINLFLIKESKKLSCVVAKRESSEKELMRFVKGL